MSENDDQRRDDDQREEDQRDDTGDAGDAQQNDAQQNNVLEWTVAVIGGLIVLTTVGYLTYKIFAGAGDPPNLHVTLGAPTLQGGTLLVPVEVENRGGSVASDAVIEVCAGDESCAELSFTYVPHQAKRSGNVGFNPPLPGPLSARVMSYHEP